MEKERPKWPLKRLARMYFGLHCWKLQIRKNLTVLRNLRFLTCKKFELPMEEYKNLCEDNIQKIIDNLEIKEMKFKEFNEIIKNSAFCKFEPREFNHCPICEKMGFHKRGFDVGL